MVGFARDRVRAMADPSTSAVPRPTLPQPHDLDHVGIWIFDLDNTLYPARCQLFDQVDRKIGEYVASYLDVDPDTARRRQKEFFLGHGSTLRGMMMLHDMQPDDYLEYVHDIDLSPVDPNPSLDEALSRLPGRKLIFTSATTAHAERVTSRLGVDHHFEGVFDVVAAKYTPKPHVETYNLFLDQHDIDPEISVFFDDIPRNLKPAAEIGMTTVWVPGRYSWAQLDDEGGYIHYVAEHLAAWLDAAVPR